MRQAVRSEACLKCKVIFKNIKVTYMINGKSLNIQKYCNELSIHQGSKNPKYLFKCFAHVGDKLKDYVN